MPIASSGMRRTVSCGRDADVERSGEQRRATDHVAVQSGDGRLRQPVELGEEPLPGTGAMAAGRPVAGDLGVRGGAEVGACGERPAGAGEHEHPHVGSLLELVEQVDDPAAHVVVRAR